MLPVAVVLGLVLAFCFGTSDYLSKGLTGKVGFYRTAVYTLATSGALVLVPLLFLGMPRLPSYSGVALLALISLSTFVAFLFMYRGYQKGHLSVVSPIVNSFPIFSVLFAVFVLRIDLSDQVLLALGGVILGILLVSTNLSAPRSRGRSLTPGVPEAVFAAFFFAVGFTSLGYAEETVGYLLPVVAARIGAASVGVLAGLALKQNLEPFGGKPFLRLLAMGGSRGVWDPGIHSRAILLVDDCSSTDNHHTRRHGRSLHRRVRSDPDEGEGRAQLRVGNLDHHRERGRSALLHGLSEK